jgi:hypothetical protein
MGFTNSFHIDSHLVAQNFQNHALALQTMQQNAKKLKPQSYQALDTLL